MTCTKFIHSLRNYIIMKNPSNKLNICNPTQTLSTSMVQTQNLSPLPNGYGVDIVDLRSMGYTSLKDLLPASPPPTPPPKGIRVERWRDIPIKDPLVQCAAWAYLQPMAEARDDCGGVFSLKRLKKTCCGLLGCFNDVVSLVVRRWIWKKTSSEENA